MKKNFPQMLALATGAVFYTASFGFADDASVGRADEQRQSSALQSQEQQQSQQFDSTLLQPGQVIIYEAAGAETRAIPTAPVPAAQKVEFGTLKKVSDVVGMDVRDQEQKKVGEVKDVMVDLPAGRVPFVVLALEEPDRLIAVPPGILNAGTEEKILLINVDKERLKGAPSFERGQWPDLANPQWGTRVYRYYNQQPYWGTSGYQGSAIKEPAGAAMIEESYGYRTHRLEPGKDYPRYGLGARGETWRIPSERLGEAAGAERVTKEGAAYGTLYRASHLTGKHVSNPQGEKVGEIKDVVIDLPSGRIAYVTFGGKKILGDSDKIVAVPPTLFTQGADSKTVVLNANPETLRTAPAFDEDNWEAVSGAAFVSEVYRHYGQQPYWQAGGGFREPSGTQIQNRQRDQFPQERKFQQKESIEIQPGSRILIEPGSQLQPQSQQSVNEPAGAQAPAQAQPSSGQKDGSLEQPAEEQKGELKEHKESPERAPEIKEPSGAEPESSAVGAEETTPEPQAESPAAGEAVPSAGVATGSEIEEPAGAAISSERVKEKVRSAIESDSSISGAQNIQVTTEGGKIRLSGTVSSEAEKEKILQKAQEALIDNQLEVKAGAKKPNPYKP